MGLYLGLVHFPVIDKHGLTIASAVTTTDLHDIARAAKTYGVKAMFVLTPLEDQQELAERVKRHWIEGPGAVYNPDRKAAMELIRVLPSLDAAVEEIRRHEGKSPTLIATDARPHRDKRLSFEELRSMLRGGGPVFLLFGTAWGLAKEVMDGVDHILEPVVGAGPYNHLSVRSAAAIILDRLAGRNKNMKQGGP